MATIKQHFESTAFILGSRRINEVRADINLVLQYFHAYFSQLAESIHDDRCKQEIIVETKDEAGKFVMYYWTRRFGDEVEYQISMGIVGCTGYAIALTGRKASAETLPVEFVIPCRELLDHFIDEMWKKHPMSEECYERLQVFYDARPC